MSRVAWKLPYISPLLYQKRFINNNSFSFRFRNSIIPSNFIEEKKKVKIFNGIWYISIQLSNNMLNCKFGEFSFTKRSDTQTHLKKKRKKKSKSKR